MTLSSVTLPVIKEQTSFCENVSKNINTIIGKIEGASLAAGVEPSVKRRRQQDVPLISAEDLKKEAVRLQEQANKCLETTQKMLQASAKKPYKSLQAKQSVLQLREKLKELGQQKARLTQVLGGQETKDVSMEVLPEQKLLEGRKDPEQRVGPSPMEVEKKSIQSELLDFERRINEIHATGNYNSDEGRKLYRELMKYDFYTLSNNSLSYDQSTSKLIEKVSLLQANFAHRYVAFKQIESLSRKIDEFEQAENFLELQNLMEMIDFVLDPSRYWEKENDGLRQKFAKVQSKIEEIREKSIRNLPSVSQKDPREEKFAELTKYERLKQGFEKEGAPEESAKRLAEQTIFQDSQREAQRLVGERVVQEGSQMYSPLASYAQRGLVALAVQDLATQTYLAAPIFIQEGVNLETIVGTTLGATSNVVRGVLPPALLAYRAYFNWSWEQRAAAAAIGIPVGVVALSFGAPALTAVGVASTVATLAGETQPSIRKRLAPNT